MRPKLGIIWIFLLIFGISAAIEKADFDLLENYDEELLGPVENFFDMDSESDFSSDDLLEEKLFDIAATGGEEPNFDEMSEEDYDLAFKATRIPKFQAGIGNFFRNLGKRIKSGFQKVGGAIKRTFQRIGPKIVNGFKKVGRAVVDWGKENIVGRTVVNFGKSVGQGFTDFIDKAKRGNLKGAFGTIGNSLKRTAIAAADMVSTVTGPIPIFAPLNFGLRTGMGLLQGKSLKESAIGAGRHLLKNANMVADVIAPVATFVPGVGKFAAQGFVAGTRFATALADGMGALTDLAGAIPGAGKFVGGALKGVAGTALKQGIQRGARAGVNQGRQSVQKTLKVASGAVSKVGLARKKTALGRSIGQNANALLQGLGRQSVTQLKGAAKKRILNRRPGVPFTIGGNPASKINPSLSRSVSNRKLVQPGNLLGQIKAAGVNGGSNKVSRTAGGRAGNLLGQIKAAGVGDGASRGGNRVSRTAGGRAGNLLGQIKAAGVGDGVSRGGNGVYNRRINRRPNRGPLNIPRRRNRRINRRPNRGPLNISRRRNRRINPRPNRGPLNIPRRRNRRINRRPSNGVRPLNIQKKIKNSNDRHQFNPLKKFQSLDLKKDLPSSVLKKVK